ncbi:ribonuclease D [Lacipirellula limnantheis]|uniref:Ribonuclease D n=1 Tax=Lacipirellula limnantheis TaxID=2528024 RepID=A0A517U3J1_9BACT|nr:HRDC domain-containing protein [Lacipirellula limnantheis]QDT75187.1 Ribonuclease D [Lacipirellula limnantheis]
MPSPIVTRQRDLDDLSDRVAAAPIIGFDTEFVSEDTFHPELCLIQVVTPDEMAVVDPQTVDVLPFWRAVAAREKTTVFHAGREELSFMLRAVGAVPQRSFDVQYAAGFCSNEFPASYGSVVGKFLGKQPMKGEQRTDWRRRPLTDAQINYALEDVRYLLPLFDRLTELLNKRGRLTWLKDELAGWQQSIVDSQDRKDWRRVSGIGTLNARNLAVVRELWLWRQDEARRLNQPPKRLLRDDLLVEIAKRKTDQPDQILAIRGLQRGDLRRKAQELAACVRRGLDAPLERGERHTQREPPPQLNLLGQFLTPALTSICRQAEVAASMVGTATDVRELIAYRYGFGGIDPNETPALLKGWRAELVGNLLDDLLGGKKSIRISDPKHEDPLAFDEVN